MTLQKNTSLPTPKIESFLASTQETAPFLVMDLDVVERNYQVFRRNIAQAELFYAVKANAARPVLERLAGLGSCFDAASLNEIKDCLAVGALASQISYGNTLKKAVDIKRAFDLGIDLFAFDSEGELDKLAEHAPGARVYCRIFTENSGAEWPLSRKFGCELDMAVQLMIKAQARGLIAYGLSFHVGSQQTDPHQWETAISRTASVFAELKSHGIELKMLNLGGGFPAPYRDNVLAFKAFSEVIKTTLLKAFGQDMPSLMIEPGRAIVATAGVLQTEVILVSEKGQAEQGQAEPRRWVYLDVGLFGGLAETMDEAIKYVFRTEKDGGPTGIVTLAGPTCDGMDILYEKTPYKMPLALTAGDMVWIDATGAYTASYSAVNFNGIVPLKVFCI